MSVSLFYTYFYPKVDLADFTSLPTKFYLHTHYLFTYKYVYILDVKFHKCISSLQIREMHVFVLTYCGTGKFTKQNLNYSCSTALPRTQYREYRTQVGHIR